MRRVFVIFFVLSVISQIGNAKTKNFGTWVEFEVSKKFLKKFEVSFIPEVRFQDDFTIDEYMFDGKLAYEPVKFLNLAASYRVNNNVRNKGNETSNRFAFDVTGSKEIGRMETSLRARFTNYTDQSDDDPGNFFRPRLKLEYDIKGNKIRPFTCYELFRNTTAKEFQKARFDVGFTRKIGKFHRIGLYYRLQDYFSDRNSIHILGIEYRLKI